jgi:hypothetical protein
MDFDGEMIVALPDCIFGVAIESYVVGSSSSSQGLVLADFGV